MQFQKEPLIEGKYQFIARILLTTFFSVSVAAGLLEIIAVAVPYGSIIVPAFLTATAMEVLFYKGEKVQIMGTCCIILVPVIITVFFWDDMVNGLAVAGNHILALIGAETGQIYLPFAGSQNLHEMDTMTIVAIVISIGLAIIGTYLFRSFHPGIAIGTTIVLVYVNSIFPDQQAGLWLVVTGLCFAVYFAWHHLGSQQLLPQLMLFVVGISCLLWLTGLPWKGTIDHWKMNTTTYLQTEIKGTANEIRYGKSDLRSMPMGDFTHLSHLDYNDTEMLRITGNQFESFYLRGFVGGTFTGESWTPLEGDTLYRNADIFYWMHKGGFFGQNLLAKATAYLDPKAEKERITYEIECIGADCRVYYTPYELTSLQTESGQVLKNSLLSEDSLRTRGWFGEDHYQIETMTNQVKRYPTLILSLIENRKNENLKSFRNTESHYNRFVYEHYTKLNDDEKVVLKKYLVKSNVKPGTHLDYDEVKKLILACLDTNVVYGEKLSERSIGSSFLSDFLEVNKTGYSVHYATAAALMFRYYGIPARYVEGYLITPERVKAASGKETLVLTDRDSHAWVEYYQDGIGWLPFEVTPPYRDVMETPAATETGASKQTVEDGVQNSLGMEMIADNYEPDVPEPEKEDKQLPWALVGLGFGMLALLTLIVLICLHLYRRKKRLDALKKACNQENRTKAMEEIFYYCMDLHLALGIQKKNISVYAYAPEIGERAGSNLEQKYMNVAESYQKAVYSQRTVSEEEWMLAQSYQKEILQIVKESNHLLRKIWLKWIKGLY